jgi:hypothetical protein
MKIIRGVATSSGRELFMNERFIFTAAIYLIFAPWSYGQAERNPQMDFGEINEAPLKGILQAIYKPYAWADLPFSLMLGFNIEQDGSLSKISLIKSSGDRKVDETGLEILSKFGESHLFKALYGLSSNTAHVELSEKNLRLRITGFSPSQSDAKAKLDMVTKQLWGVTRKAQKDSEIVELLSRLKIRNTDKRVEIELNVPRAKRLK